MTVMAFPRLEPDLSRLRAHQPDQLFMHDLDHHLPRIQPVHYVLSDRALLDVFYKAFYNFEIDIRFQECHLNLSERGFYIILGKPSLAAQVPEYILKFFC